MILQETNRMLQVELLLKMDEHPDDKRGTLPSEGKLNLFVWLMTTVLSWRLRFQSTLSVGVGQIEG
jgi:hypothetical protein